MAMAETGQHKPEPTPAQIRRGRRIALLLFAIGFGPMIVASVMFYTGWMNPTGQSNNGTLVQPPVAVSDLGLVNGEGILEISAMFFTSSVIEGATKEVARQIRTGQIQESGDPLTAFQNQLCDSLLNVIDCAQVTFHVQTFASFGAVSMPLEVDEDGNIVNTTFVPGGSSAVTVVRAMYRWEFATPLIDSVIPAGLGGHLIVSTVAFQNEPYDVN